ncbi:ABC transporter ATP-binding protein [Cryobacterium gelidum]|nr:ABC transporter ATP-binding protein [Cryobacterium gelidum]
MSSEDSALAAEDRPLLSLHAVSKTYRTARETTSVLKALDLELPRGEITCLVGPSGCGKSTLVSLIAGLLVPDSGQVIFDGQDIGALPDTRRAQLRATRIGIVLQSGNLVPFLTAGENIALAIRLAGRTARAAHIHALLKQVDLEDRAGHLPRRLSGGEAQRVAVALALANDPELLLADEAVGQLDGATARVVINTLHTACRDRGLAVLLVTHNPEIVSLSSRVLRLSGGHLERAS